MGRLIDADIMKKASIATREEPNSYADHVVCDFALKMLNAVRTEDAVKVIRCGKCKYFHKNNENDPYCNAKDGLSDPTENTFCSYGERRSDE